MYHTHPLWSTTCCPERARRRRSAGGGDGWPGTSPPKPQSTASFSCFPAGFLYLFSSSLKSAFYSIHNISRPAVEHHHYDRTQLSTLQIERRLIMYYCSRPEPPKDSNYSFLQKNILQFYTKTGNVFKKFPKFPLSEFRAF